MTALDRALPLLRCPVCREALTRDGGTLRCTRGHTFDVGRQGHVSLLQGAHPHAGDTAPMLAARAAFLGSGHYAPIAAAVVDTVAAHAPPGPVLDLAAGTGWYAAAVLDAAPERLGVAVDVSTAALRRAARVHPRLAAVGADAWATLPMPDATFAAALSVFGPRTPEEIARVLGPAGVVVVVTPTARHLVEIREALGMLEPAADKAATIRRTFAGFEQCAATTVEATLHLDAGALAAVVGMGPAGHHIDPTAVAARAHAYLAGRDRVPVTASVEVITWRRPAGAR